MIMLMYKIYNTVNFGQQVTVYIWCDGIYKDGVSLWQQLQLRQSGVISVDMADQCVCVCGGGIIVAIHDGGQPG